MAKDALEQPEEFACESCGGMGFKKVAIAKNGHDDTPPDFPDCSACGGTGVMTAAECEAFRDRN